MKPSFDNMIWNNEIGLSDVISIIAILLSLATLVLLLVQRRDSSTTELYLSDNQSVVSTNSNEYDGNRLHLSLRVVGQEYVQNVSVSAFLYSDGFNKTIDFYENDKRGWRLENFDVIKSEFISKEEPLDISNALLEYVGILNEMWTKNILLSFNADPPRAILRPAFSLYLLCRYRDFNNYEYKKIYVIESRLSTFHFRGTKDNYTECFLKIQPASKAIFKRVYKSSVSSEDYWYKNSFK